MLIQMVIFRFYIIIMVALIKCIYVLLNILNFSCFLALTKYFFLLHAFFRKQYMLVAKLTWM